MADHNKTDAFLSVTVRGMLDSSDSLKLTGANSRRQHDVSGIDVSVQQRPAYWRNGQFQGLKRVVVFRRPSSAWLSSGAAGLSSGADAPCSDTSDPV